MEKNKDSAQGASAARASCVRSLATVGTQLCISTTAQIANVSTGGTKDLGQAAFWGIAHKPYKGDPTAT